MHIPSSMLHGAICPVTLTVAGAGVAAAGYLAYRADQKPTAAAFGAVTAMVFSAQMLNFPIAHGTSAHVLGGVLAASLLGTPFAILSITLVLAVQAVFFADGSLATLGANAISMALVGAGLGGVLLNALRAKGLSKPMALGCASFVSVVLAAIVCSFAVALGSTMPLSTLLPGMVAVYAACGLAEAAITVVLVKAFEKVSVAYYAPAALALAFAVALATPWASVLPDGLEQASKISTLQGPSLAMTLTGLLFVYLSALTTGKLIKGRALCKTSI